MGYGDSIRKKYGITGDENKTLSIKGKYNAYDEAYDEYVNNQYNQLGNADIPRRNISHDEYRQLSAREKYAQRDNESNRQRNLALPKTTVQKDTSRIGDLEDALIEQKKYSKESKQKKESLSNSWKPYATETRDERDARVRQRYKDEQRIRELEDILAGNSRIEQPKSVNDVGSLEDSLIQNKKYGAPVEIAEQPKSIDLERERAIEYTNAGNELYDLKQKIAKEDAQIEERNRLKKMEQYYDLLNNSDFQQKSAYSPTGGKADNPMAKIRGYQDYAFDFILYDAINGNRDAYDALRYVNSPAYQPEWADYNSEQTQELTESEKRIFNYIYKTQGKKAAIEYYNLLQPELEKRAAETELNQWRQEAREHPVGTAIASALMAPARALEYPLQLIDYAATGKINQYSPNSSASRIRNAVSETITEGWGKVGSFAYQTGMSMVDFLINLGMGAAIGGGVGALGENATLLLMGSAAAADETVAKKQAGYDDKRTFILGAIAGAAETVTERIGFDALFKTDVLKKGAKGFASYLLRNAASEGAEEGLSDIINWFADDMYDAFASQSESEWKRTIRALKEAHPDYSDSRLFGIALAQRAEELGLDIAGGMVSGIAMAGGMSAINAIGNDIGTRNTGKEIRAVGDDVVQSAIAEGLESKPDTQSYKLATALNEKLQRGEQLTNKEIGQLYQANVEAINAENAETDAKKLQLPTIEERSTVQSAARNNQNLYLQEEAQRNILEARQTVQDSENASDAESNATLATQENATETRTAPESIAKTKRLQLPTVKENNNVRGENDLRNGSERYNSTNPGEQVRAVEEGAGRDTLRQTATFAKDDGAVSVTHNGEAQSARELTGLDIFDDTDRSFYEATGNLSRDMQAAKKSLAALGLNLRIWLGGNLTRNDGASIEGVISGKDVWVRGDHPHFTSSQLAGHEKGHYLIDSGAISSEEMREIIKQLTSKDFVDSMINEYGQRWNKGRLPLTKQQRAEAIAGLYAGAFEGSDLTVEQIWDEIVCDSIGNMNRFEGVRAPAELKGKADTLLQYTGKEAGKQASRAPPSESRTESKEQYSRGWRNAQRGRSIEQETMENNRFERLRTFDEMPPIWYAYTSRYFYAYENSSFTDYDLLSKIPLTERNKATIDLLTEEIKNDVIRTAKDYRGRIESLRPSSRGYNRNNVGASNRRATVGDGGLSVRDNRQSSKQTDNISESSRNSETVISDLLRDTPAKEHFSREFTPTAEDTAYLNAVNSNDMETAQKMVDEAAKKAEYKQYGDFYADSSLDLAVPKPTKQQLKTYELGQKYGNTESGYDKFYDEDFDAYEQIMLDDVANLKRWYLAGARGEMPSYRLAIRYGDVPSGKRSKNWATGELERGVSAVNFLTEKTQGEKTIYDAIYGMQGVDKNIIGGWDFGIYGSDGEPLLVDAENVVPFSDISKLKLADPVTYDDSGNVIPLSERFNEKNEDIRYSREFDADLFGVNEDIRKRIASPKASGNGLAWKGSPAAAKVDVDKLAEQIVSTYSSTLKAADIAKELASINDSIKALRKNMTVSEFEKLQDTTDELAKKILANALAKETGVKAELQDEPAGLNEYSYYQKKAISLITADVLDSLLGGGQAVSAQNKKAAAQNIKLNNIRKAANEIMTSKQILADYVDQYGAIKKGEKASRDIQTPNKTGKDKKLSQTVRTILEAKATPDSIVPDIEYLAATGDFSYTRYSDKAAIQKAEETIKDKGWERALKDWLVDVNQNGEVSKTNTAIGWALYNAAANAGDVEAAIDVLDALVKHQRNAAQAVQATRILKQLSPDAQLYGVARSVQNLQDDINEKYGEAKAPKLKIDEDLAQKFLDAKTQEERTKILQDIYRDIGRQMPTKFIDRWNAWRYLAMLGNPRTHVRNIVGNLGFTPVVMAKNLTATAIESAVDFVSGGRLNRTKGNIIGKRGSADILKAAWSDYDNVAEAALGGGKYSDFANANKYIEEGRRIFGKTKLKAWNKTGGRALEAYRKASGYALDKEDVWFSKPHYAIAFAQYAQANGITADQIRSGKGLEDARAYALQEAQKATYRDTNAFSQAVSRLGRGNKSSKNAFEKGLSTLAEGILPFRKTPANILARGVEYSPLGLLKSLSYDIVKVKQGKMTGAQMIDDVAAGLTGTGLLALGLFLASLGLVRGHGSDDDKEKAFADLMGHQAYSLELPGGKSITLDWLAPESLPFFIGVNLYEMTQGGKKDVTLATMLEAVGYATEPMLEMSCLKSLNDIFDAVGYAKEGDMNALTSTIVSAATSYLTQGLPTLLGQIERTIEGKRMTTYTEKNKFLTGDLQYTLGKASARVPGVDYEQIPYIDAWGREELTGTALSRAFNNFLNPSFVSNINESEMEKELERLYKATDDSSVFPQRAKKYFNVDGERKDLTGEEYVTYATAKGQTAYQMLGAIIGSDEYKKLDDEQKIKVIDSVYTYADQTAKTLVGGEVTDSTTQKALFLKDYNVPPESYVFFKTVVATQFDEDDNGSISQEELEKAIDAVSGRNPKGLSLPSDKSTTVLTNAQKAALWQTYNKGWKAKNNPYDKTIGQEIYNKLHDGSADEEPEAEATTQTVTQTKTAKEEKPKEETINTANSTMFSAASYNSGTLNLTFRSTKRTYSYENVPESVWEDMKKADSLGNFYNSNIKGKYTAA